MGLKVKKPKLKRISPQPEKKSIVAGAVTKAVPIATAAAKPQTPEPEKGVDQVLNASALDSLIAQADEATTGTRSLMEPQVVADGKRKRGRPRNDEKKPEPEVAEAKPPSFDCKPACQMVFGITSEWMGRYAGDTRVCLLPKEIEALGNAWGAVCERYMPAFLAEHGELVVAVTVTGMTATRLYSVAKEISKERQAEIARRTNGRREAQADVNRASTTTELETVVQ